MASKKEENILHENLGRCTRSGRRLSAMPIITASPSRTTRRSAKKLQEHMVDTSIDNNSNAGNVAFVSNEQVSGDNNSATMPEIITENAQKCGTDLEHKELESNIVSLPAQLTIDDIIVEETENEDEEKDEMNFADTIIEECNSYEDEEQEQEHMEHVEEMEIFETIPTEEENPVLTVVGLDQGLDLEKSSSFSFDTAGGNSETSEDLIDNNRHILHSIQNNEQEQKHPELLQRRQSQKLHLHQLHGNSLEDNNGSVEISLLASLAGDNANSLPSVGGGESEELSEEICKKDDYESKVLLVEHCEKMDSESDSMSENAIAEDLIGEDGALMMSDATIINTELVSEDELPPLTLIKPQINDAEEVSDEELPAPKRAELPPDAELISDDDELPIRGVQSVGALSSSTAKRQQHNTGVESSVIIGKKRKCNNSPILANSTDITSINSMEDVDNDQHSIENEKIHQIKDKSEQYNPMSPTSESSDSIISAPVEKKAKFEDSNDVAEEEENIDKDENEQTQETVSTVNNKENVKESEKVKEEKKERKRLPELDKYWRAVKSDPTDFTGWTYLLQYVDNESDAEAAREAYDAFLSHYPYCYGYWRKYADYEKRKGLKANCNAVFERGLEAIPLSVDLWIHYLTYVKSNPHHKPAAEQEQFVRSQFKRAVNTCGLEFRSDKLWDAYIKWENETKSYQRIVKIYDRLLTIPTQGYSGHFDNLHELINQHPINLTMTADEILQLRAEIKGTSETTTATSDVSNRSKEGQSSDNHHDPNVDVTNEANGDQEASLTHSMKSESNINNTINNKLILKEPVAPPPPPPLAFAEDDQHQNNATTIDKDFMKTFTEEECNAIKERFISKRRKIHKNTATAVSSRWSFEEGIKRPYFHVKPLERCQLKNWRDYLDFEIEKGDRNRILVLFERCLIACALYEEFWLKMLRYLETQNDPKDESSSVIIDIIRDVYRRACDIHHPDKPSLHLMWVAFEECQGNFEKAAEILTRLEVRVPNLLQIAYRRVNVERRRGDYTKCKQLYEHYIETAKNKNIAGSLAIKYARFLNKICHDLDGGLNVLQQALEKDPANTRVVLQMIDLALQRSRVNESEVVAIMDKFMSRDSIDLEQRVLFAQRKVEFLEDFGSTAKGLQDAQRDLQTALTKANEAKKKRDSSPSRKNNKDGSSMSNTTSASMYNSVNTNVNLNNSGTVGSATTASPQTTTGYTYNSNNSTVAYYGQQQSQQQQQSAHHHHHQTSGSYPPQQSYDNYYNHWQYGSGYSGYGQWSGYGNYY